MGAGSCCAGYVDGANARLRPHPLDKWYLVDELMLQSAQNMQADENDQRRDQYLMPLIPDVRQHRIFANRHIEREQAEEINRRSVALGADHQPTGQRHGDHEDVE